MCRSDTDSGKEINVLKTYLLSHGTYCFLTTCNFSLHAFCVSFFCLLTAFTE